jgi:hypothetical protein
MNEKTLDEYMRERVHQIAEGMVPLVKDAVEEEYKEAEALYHKSIKIKHKVCVVYFITLPYYHRLSIGIGRE